LSDPTGSNEKSREIPSNTHARAPHDRTVLKRAV